MLLTTKQALVYCNIAKPNFTRRKLQHTMDGKKKMFNTDILDATFPNAPKILPPKEEIAIIPVTSSTAIDIDTHGMKLFDTLSEIFFEDVDAMNEVDESKISSLTICQLQIQVIESHIVKNPLDMDLMTSLNRLLKNEEMILKYLPKQRIKNEAA